jgi:hypothetical protein
LQLFDPSLLVHMKLPVVQLELPLHSVSIVWNSS